MTKEKPPEGGDPESFGGDDQHAKDSTKPATPVFERCRVCLTPLKREEVDLCPACKYWQPILQGLGR